MLCGCVNHDQSTYEPLDEVQQYERGNVVEIYDGIIFDFNTSTYLSL